MKVQHCAGLYKQINLTHVSYNNKAGFEEHLDDQKDERYTIRRQVKEGDFPWSKTGPGGISSIELTSIQKTNNRDLLRIVSVILFDNTYDDDSVLRVEVFFFSSIFSKTKTKLELMNE